MTHNWKPGDVAMSAYGHVFRTSGRGGTWIYDDGSGQSDSPTTTPPGGLRPLVVIDPEDGEQVERLADLFTEHHHSSQQVNTASEHGVRSMQAALRSLLAPPRPRCVAHGVPECTACSRISSESLTPGGECRGCPRWGTDGLHWDTCSERIRGTVFANRDEAVVGS